MTNNYFIKIENKNEQYQATIYKNSQTPSHITENLKLSPNDKVTIKGNPYTLEQLIEALIQYQENDLKLVYDERGQMEFGQYLYQQLFNNADPNLLRSLRNENAQLRIITQDEHITRLPWVLLADENSIFLSATGCAISLSTRIDCYDHELPHSPKILIAMPQPGNLPETQAEPHLEKLEDMLTHADHRYYQGRNLRTVSTWEDFQEQVKLFQPDAIYYYGHGIGDKHTSALAFTTGNTRKQHNVSVSDIADFFRHLATKMPSIAYLNCCLGDAGGLFGAGRQLGNLIPAVITNRTIAEIEAARAQAMSFWRSTLLDGLAPHKALNDIRHNIAHTNLTFADARWMTPVLHRHYNNWKAHPPERVNRLKHDPYWHLKLDRVHQFAHVYYLTDQMLKERKPRSLAYTWYGTEGQGVDMFHHRLKIELREKLTNTHVYEIRPDWPIEFEKPYQSFEDMMTEAFGVQTLDHIPTNIRNYSRGQIRNQTLVYIRHSPLRTTKVITLNRLKTYLEWWDCHFTPLLEKHSFALLGISFVVGNPGKFRKTLIDKKRINDLQLQDTLFNLLDEMDKVVKKDLLDFLKAHSIRLPRKRQDKVLEEILEQTGGQYEMTLEALKDIVNRAWDLSDEDEETGASDEDEEEFGIDD
ncbi:MAG: CHAT domain-containing protein [Desulfobacteraceae bacterium]|nr:CHAT domain-containing protein [Desulfobacteraceae bacterium]